MEALLERSRFNPLVNPLVEKAVPLRPAVLLAEDNPVDRRIFVRHLAKYNFDVCVAENGREAIESFRGADFALIIMDCHMPCVDGFEATRAIRKLEPPASRRTPIVALTGDDDRRVWAACMAAGMDAYFTKPLHLDDFGRILKSLIPHALEVRHEIRGERVLPIVRG